MRAAADRSGRSARCEEVKKEGGRGHATTTRRTWGLTMMAIFDATVFGLCVCVLSVWRVTVICGVWVLWVVSGLGERVR